MVELATFMRSINREPFAPGNLVYGAPMRDFPSLFRLGLRPPAAFGLDEESSPTPDEICFGMMGRLAPGDRYLRTQHKGPKNVPSAEPMVGIIIARQPLLDRFFDYVKAVGSAFYGKAAQVARRYDFSPDGKKVYGIEVNPLRPFTKDNEGFYDQVRLYAADLTRTIVSPDMWEDVVINSLDKELFQQILEEHKLQLDIPVVDPRGTRLAL